MKKLTALMLALCLLLTCTFALADTAIGRLNQRIATRSGPGTEYFEPGSFLKQGDYVTVHTKAWDNTNEMWWVQVEFTVENDTYRAYTGAWRMDADLTDVPEEKPLGIVRVTSDADVFAGPGWDYVMWNDTVYRGTSAVLLEVEAGYAHIECWNDSWNQPWRVWAPLRCLSCAGDYTSTDDTYPSNSGYTGNNGYTGNSGASRNDAQSGASTSTSGNYNSTVNISPVGHTVRIGASSGNARSGAGTEYPIVEYVFCGERFTILDSATAFNGKTWYQIKKDGVLCWISSGICTVD